MGIIDKYSVIYADPPWSYGDRGFGKRIFGAVSSSYNPGIRYNTLSTKSICDLGNNITALSAKNCVLFLWVTSPLLPDGFEVIKSWRFHYKTIAFCWSKLSQNGKLVTNLGHYTLGNIELCLLATKGCPKIKTRTIKQFIQTPRLQHSAKPEEVRNRIEAMFDGPYLELFARTRVKNWDAFGNEVESSIFLPIK